MNNYFAHQELIKKRKLELCKRFVKSIRIFDRPIGLFYTKRVIQNTIDYEPIKVGKKGQCDAYAVLMTAIKYYVVNGKNPFPLIPVHIELEFKTGKGNLNPDQVVWRDFCFSMGWIWIEVRENTDLIEAIRVELDKRGLVWTE